MKDVLTFKRRLLLGLVLVFGLLAVQFVQAPKTSAIPGSEFPSPNNTNAPNNAFAIVTIADGVTVTLNSPVAYFKVFYPASMTSNEMVYIMGGCWNPGQDVMDPSISASVSIPDGANGWILADSRAYPGGCGAGNFEFPVNVGAIGTQPDYYGTGWRVLLVTVNKTGGVGIKNFRVAATNGQARTYK